MGKIDKVSEPLKKCQNKLFLSKSPKYVNTGCIKNYVSSLDYILRKIQ